MSSGSDVGGAGGGEASGAEPPADRLHQRPFKLRFAAQRQLGRSYVSPTRPMGLPSVIKDKFYRRDSVHQPQLTDAIENAERRVEQMFHRNRRDRCEQPLTTAQEYGWWCYSEDIKMCTRDKHVRLHYHIRDSAWMKEQLRVLTANAGFKRL